MKQVAMGKRRDGNGTAWHQNGGISWSVGDSTGVWGDDRQHKTFPPNTEGSPARLRDETFLVVNGRPLAARRYVIGIIKEPLSDPAIRVG